MNFKTPLCKECVADLLEETEKNDAFSSKYISDDYKNKCDCCGAEVKSHKCPSNGSNVDVRICLTSWNSSYLCTPCVIKIFREGKNYSSMSQWDTITSNSYQIGIDGLYLNKNGHVKLFWLN